MMNRKRTRLPGRYGLAAILIFVLSILSLTAGEIPEEVLAAKKSITANMLTSHIQFLASGFCRGREPGDKGIEIAAAYLDSVFRGIGANPCGDMGHYQDVKLYSIDLSDRVSLKMEERAGTTPIVRECRLEWDYLPIYISGQGEVNAPVVFAGYGITAPEHNYDDYRNIDARGKIVLVLRHEPGENDEKSAFEGRKNSTHGTLLTKILNAQKHGAVGILFATDPLNHEDRSLEANFSSGANWASLRTKRFKDEEDFKYFKFKPRLRIEGDDFGVKIPAVIIAGKLADGILGGKRSLRSIQENIDKSLKPNSFNISGKRLNLQIYFETKKVQTFNVVAKIEGSDPELKNEVVVVGAHYDHLGKNNRGQVFRGADDNASGTAAVLEIARALQNMKTKPKRSVICILFTAEEKGLLGAKYYTQNPIVSLDKTIALVNLDMISRNDASQLNVIGKYQFPKLFKIVDEMNKETMNFELNFTVEDLIRNSDHFAFVRHNVPSIFFSSGLHDEFHTPRDTVFRTVKDKLEKAAQLAFLTVWQAADLPAGTSLK